MSENRTEPRVHDERQVVERMIRAVQWAELPGAPAEVLGRLRPDALERLVGAYFRQAERLTLGSIRSRWDGERLELRPPLGPPVLCFRVVERYQRPDGARLTLGIVGGLLAGVDRQRGTMSLALEPRDGRLVARLTLDEYRPRPADLPLVGYLYDLVQARTHALHGRRFLRWLARHWQGLTENYAPPSGS